MKSGKWSMAVVMVIAIFMAYIGFNGIITSQFGQLSVLSQKLVILTTNGTDDKSRFDASSPETPFYIKFSLLNSILEEIFVFKLTFTCFLL